MIFFIYSRKSVFTGKGESLENQVDMCKKYIFSKFPDAKENNIFIYEDEGFSGKNIDRPNFKKMLNDMKVLNATHLICYRLDRISRSVSDFSSLIEELNRRDISLICIKEEFDTSKPMGKAMMYIASVFAQLERETIAERVRDNMLMLARTGRWLGGTPPLGFTSEKTSELIIDGKIKVSCKLKENQKELEIVKCMYDKYSEYKSLSAVKKYLDSRNITSRNGKAFSVQGIKQILANPVYCISDYDAYQYFTRKKSDISFNENECNNKYGLIAYNKRDYRKKHAPRQSENNWVIALGKHNGLISGMDWVNTQLFLKDSARNRNNIHNEYSLLAGILFCGKCQCKMIPKMRSDSSDKFDYICSSKLYNNNCNCQNIDGNYADDKVYDFLKALAPDTETILKKNIDISDLKLTKELIFNSFDIEKKRLFIKMHIKKIEWDEKNFIVSLNADS